MNNPQGSYDVRYDIDLDGDNDATDKSIAQTYYQGTTLGWDTLSTNPDTGTGNRKGYAGYEYHEAVSLYHIRNRVLHPELGRWTRRDPLGYVDGLSVYEYVGSRTLSSTDSHGVRHQFKPGDFIAPGIPIPYFKQISPPTKSRQEQCCDYACNFVPDGSAPPFARTMCCDGQPLSCYCEDRWKEIFDYNNNFHKHAMSCIKRCEPIHKANIDCSKAFDKNGDGFVINPDEGLPWIDPVCGDICSEAGVIGCAAACFEEFDCETLNTQFEKDDCKHSQSAYRKYADKLRKDCNDCEAARYRLREGYEHWYYYEV